MIKPTKYVWIAKWRESCGDVIWACYISNFDSLQHGEMVNEGWAVNEQLMGIREFFEKFDFRSPFLYNEKNAMEILIEFVEYFSECFNIVVVEHPNKI